MKSVSLPTKVLFALLVMCSVAQSLELLEEVGGYSVAPPSVLPWCEPFSGKFAILNYTLVPEGFCPYVFTSNLDAPRGMFVAENNDVLVIQQGTEQLTVLWDDNGDGISDPSERAVLAEVTGLNHAVLVYQGYVYASNASNVFRWPYTAGDRSNLGDYEVIVNSIPVCCDHVTRTLLFDTQGLFYVQEGSGSNVDPNSYKARIRRFDLSLLPTNGSGFNYTYGYVFADGLRNEVGIRMDSQGRIWGVENGVDDLYRADLGGDIHLTNPSEELNLFAEEGLFYGYPYCWSEYQLLINHSEPIGSQWVHPDFMNSTIYSDAWCNNDSNVVKPMLNIHPHYAPLDIYFWSGPTFPSDYVGDAFVTSHGSWNSDPPVGYKVLRVYFNETNLPYAWDPFLEYTGPGDTGPGYPHRPVALEKWQSQFGDTLLVSSDASNIIIGVFYVGSNDNSN